MAKTLGWPKFWRFWVWGLGSSCVKLAEIFTPSLCPDTGLGVRTGESFRNNFYKVGTWNQIEARIVWVAGRGNARQAPSCHAQQLQKEQTFCCFSGFGLVDILGTPRSHGGEGERGRSRRNAIGPGTNNLTLPPNPPAHPLHLGQQSATSSSIFSFSSSSEGGHRVPTPQCHIARKQLKTKKNEILKAKIKKVRNIFFLFLSSFSFF